MREFNIKICETTSYCIIDIGLLVFVMDQLQFVLVLPCSKIGRLGLNCKQVYGLNMVICCA
jgi:hypothetical protein